MFQVVMNQRMMRLTLVERNSFGNIRKEVGRPGPELLSAPRTTIRTTKQGNNKQPLNWLKIRWLRFERESPLVINFRETLNEIYPFREIDKKEASGCKTHNKIGFCSTKMSLSITQNYE